MKNLKDCKKLKIIVRYNLGKGNGMELPIDYRFIGNEPYLTDLRKELQQLKSNNTACVLKNITAIEKIHK